MTKRQPKSKSKKKRKKKRMTQPKKRLFAIDEQQLGFLQEYFLSTPMPYKQSQPFIQLLTSLQEINVQAAPVATPVDPSGADTPPPMVDSTDD